MLIRLPFCTTGLLFEKRWCTAAGLHFRSLAKGSRPFYHQSSMSLEVYSRGPLSVPLIKMADPPCVRHSDPISPFRPAISYRLLLATFAFILSAPSQPTAIVPSLVLPSLITAVTMFGMKIIKPLIWVAALLEGAVDFVLPEVKRLMAGVPMPRVEALPRLIGQLAIAVTAYRLSLVVAWGLRKWCSDNSIDVTTAVFLAELLRYGVLLLMAIILFQAFGIQTPESFTAIVTSLTLAIGLSFQSVLSNFAAGIMLLVFRPYIVGDKVKIGNRIGFVYDISLLATRCLDSLGHSSLRDP